jgi:hypothetical protein
MARITVIKSDGFVAIDGEGYLKCDVSFLDDTVHAIQWYNTDGEIERKDARGRMVANDAITSLEPFESQIRAAWNAKKAEVAAAKAALENAANG